MGKEKRMLCVLHHSKEVKPCHWFLHVLFDKLDLLDVIILLINCNM